MENKIQEVCTVFLFKEICPLLFKIKLTEVEEERSYLIIFTSERFRCTVQISGLDVKKDYMNKRFQNYRFKGHIYCLVSGIWQTYRWLIQRPYAIQ